MNELTVKLYTPKGAVRAMLTGKMLRQKGGYVCFWDDKSNAFIAKERAGLKSHTMGSFSGLYEDLKD